MRILTYAAIIVAVTLGLYLAVLQAGNEVASAVAQSIFIIASWVAVWDSMENLVFDVLDERRMIGVWQKVGELDLVIQPHPRST